MPSNPLTQEEVNSYAINRILNPEGYTGLSPYMPAGYFLSTPPGVTGPALWRLFDASFISSGIIDPNRLGTGSTGAGNLYLADDGTWKAVSGGGATTLDGLTDVTISAPANAQVLTYNSTTSQWENQTPSGGGGGGDMYKSTYDVDNDGVVDSAETTQIIVRNSTGSTLTKGQVVYLNGATGYRPNAVLSQANTEATSSKTIGIVVANISNNSDGYVAVSGTLHNLNTSAFADGVALWLSATTAGAMTSTIPAEPNHTVFIGYVARSHPTQGRLVILVQNGYELNELHGVLISSEANNDLLTYESSTGLWKNKTFSAIFGGTPLVSVPTLAQVTTAGNTTTNAITVGGLTVDSDTLFVDATNHSVGIGTTSPLAKLHIATNTGGTNTVLRLSVAPNSANVIHFRDTDGTSQGGFLATGSTFSYGTYQAAQVNLAGGLGGIGLRTNNGNAHIRFYSGNADGDFSPEIARFVASTGNLLLNTTTDAGYKLDVNGTVRLGNDTLVKGSNTAGNVVGFEVQNSAATSAFQIFNDGQARFYNTVRFYNSLILNDIIARNVGITLDTNGIRSTNFIGSVTASSAIARGVYFNNTLVAAANSDVLVGLDINPTFTNGAFTGVQNWGLRVQNSNILLSTDKGVYFGNLGYGINGNTGVGQVVIYTNSVARLTVDNVGKVTAGGNARFANVALTGSNIELLNGLWYFNIENDGYGLQVKNVTNSNSVPLRIFRNDNVAIGTTTDSGYKLDVNGTIRAQNKISIVYSDNAYNGGLLIQNTNTGTNSLCGFNFADSAGNLVVEQIYYPSNFLPSPYANSVAFNSMGQQRLGFTANSRNSGSIAQDIYFSTLGANSTYQLQIKGNGNVQINTNTDSGYRLDVNGTFRTTSTITATLANVTTANVIYYDSSTGLMTYGAAPSGGGTPTLATVTTAGNTTTNSISVGGLTVANGAAPIAVFNSSNVGGTYVGIQYGGALKAAWGMGGNIIGGLSINDVGYWSSNAMAWEAGGAQRMFLTASGNLLINTISDNGNRLQVNGTIDGQGFASSGVPGYTGVFTVPTNPPGMQNLQITGGIITGVS